MLELPAIPQGYDLLMQRHVEAPAESMTSYGTDAHGREILLTRETGMAWLAMRANGEADGVALVLISGFRSVERQTAIISRKLEAGLSLAAILRWSAYPGFSEHHTGRAIDIGNPHIPPLTEAFEFTPEFAWLLENAQTFGFTLSYPRDNPTGVGYEPWQWLKASSSPG